MRSEQGEKAGFGTSLNIPLQAGVGNKGYEKVFDDVVLPAIRKFKPEMIFVASGFDSCVYDPLGRMLLTANGYAKLTKKLMEVADEICDGKILMTHEGGYSAIYSPFVVKLFSKKCLANMCLMIRLLALLTPTQVMKLTLSRNKKLAKQQN